MLNRALDAIVIGGSAGAIEALGVILPALPKEAKVPVVVLVHLPPRRESLLVEIFEKRCALRVREPEDKEPLGAGIWFAPPDYHLLIERDHTFALSIDEPVRFSRPSIDVLFESAGDAFGAALCAVVLTGANDDGTAGARRVKGAGGIVLVQDPESAECKEMPTAAIRSVATDFIGDPPGLARVLRDISLGIPS